MWWGLWRIREAELGPECEGSWTEEGALLCGWQVIMGGGLEKCVWQLFVGRSRPSWDDVYSGEGKGEGWTGGQAPLQAPPD